MVVLNWNLPNLSTDVLLKTLVINNTLPFGAKYNFNSPLNIYLEGLIDANVSGYINSRLIYTIPTEIRVYKDGVLDSTLPQSEITYTGFLQTTKHSRYINVSDPGTQVPFVQELYLGMMKYQFNQANVNYSFTGTYTFRCTFAYSLYSDDSGGGSYFGYMNNYGVKTNPLVATSNFYNGAYSNGSIDEIGFTGATTYLGYKKISDSYPLMCFPGSVRETNNSNQSRILWAVNANSSNNIVFRLMPANSLFRKCIISLDNDIPFTTSQTVWVSVFIYSVYNLSTPSSYKYRQSGTAYLNNGTFNEFKSTSILFYDNTNELNHLFSPYKLFPLPTDPIFGGTLDVDPITGDVLPIDYQHQIYAFVTFSTDATSAAAINSTLITCYNHPIFDFYYRGWTTQQDGN